MDILKKIKRNLPKVNLKKIRFHPYLRSLTQIILAGITYLTFWKKTAWVFNIPPEKRAIIKKFFPQYNFYFLSSEMSVYERHILIKKSYKPIFLVWGMTQPFDLDAYAQENDIRIVHVEDGFLRAIGLGAEDHFPYSICVDSLSMYYDSTKPSSLEMLIQNYDFAANPSLMYQAKSALQIIRSKHTAQNNKLLPVPQTSPNMARFFYGCKHRPRILVIGQIEDEAALLYGCERILTNIELIKLAVKENPGAQIIYKPHPEILRGTKNDISSPQDLQLDFEILSIPISLADALYEVDRVYTLTSLAGLEALIYGVPVTTVGSPFYSGWGLTDDREKIARRTRKVMLEELFAAAYILYPLYLDPKTKRKTNFLNFINKFTEHLEMHSEGGHRRENPAFKPLKLLNLKTEVQINPLFIYKSSSEKIALIIDNEEGIHLAKQLTNFNKIVYVITTRDFLANNILVDVNFHKKIKLCSLHTFMGSSHSRSEQKSVALAQGFSNNLVLTLLQLQTAYFTREMINALALSLEDYIYQECLRFFGAEACLEQFDSSILLIKDLNKHQDILQSFIYHARTAKTKGQAFIYPLSDEEAVSLLKKDPIPPPQKKEPEIKKIFNSFWYDLEYHSSFNVHLNSAIAVCGNIDNENYAYSPSSFQLLEACSGQDVIYFPSSLSNEIILDAAKVNLTRKINKQLKVYQGNWTSYQRQYSPDLFARGQKICESLFQNFLTNTRTSLSDSLIQIFYPRIKKYFDKLPTYFFFISEASRIFDHTRIFITSMDRVPLSRILAAIAKVKNIPSIGIQPQIISTSARYVAPAVQTMGVIDNSQVEIFKQLGANRTSLIPIGSVNLFSRLIKIDQFSHDLRIKMGKPILLFAMQHSSAETMIRIAKALNHICQKYDLNLIIKPHPHQETPVLLEIKELCNNYPLTKVLSKNVETYEYIAQSAIIIGLFSSVLFESAISGKDVIVCNFIELDDSINFTKLGLALEAKDESDLEFIISEIISQGEKYQQLKHSRAQYLTENPQFQRPYSYKTIENFLKLHIDKMPTLENSSELNRLTTLKAKSSLYFKPTG